MLVYNTTFQVSVDHARNFVIWISEHYIPTVQQHGLLSKPRLTQILSHKEEDSECFSLQWEVENSANLHKWYSEQGNELNKELSRIFQEQVVGFPTLMEVIL